jgi:hypothetical protein
LNLYVRGLRFLLDHPAGLLDTGFFREFQVCFNGQKVRRECAEAVRDKLFGDLIKAVVTWEFPTISIAYFGNLGFAGAVTAFAAGVRGVVPHVVDYVSSKRAAGRKHAVSYLIGLSKR